MSVELLDKTVLRKLIPQSTSSEIRGATENSAVSQRLAETAALPSQDLEHAIRFSPGQVHAFNPLNEW